MTAYTGSLTAGGGAPTATFSRGPLYTSRTLSPTVTPNIQLVKLAANRPRSWSVGLALTTAVNFQHAHFGVMAVLPAITAALVRATVATRALTASMLAVVGLVGPAAHPRSYSATPGSPSTPLSFVHGHPGVLGAVAPTIGVTLTRATAAGRTLAIALAAAVPIASPSAHPRAFAPSASMTVTLVWYYSRSGSFSSAVAVAATFVRASVLGRSVSVVRAPIIVVAGPANHPRALAPSVTSSAAFVGIRGWPGNIAVSIALGLVWLGTHLRTLASVSVASSVSVTRSSSILRILAPSAAATAVYAIQKMRWRALNAIVSVSGVVARNTVTVRVFTSARSVTAAFLVSHGQSRFVLVLAVVTSPFARALVVLRRFAPSILATVSTASGAVHLRLVSINLATSVATLRILALGRRLLPSMPLTSPLVRILAPLRTLPVSLPASVPLARGLVLVRALLPTMPPSILLRTPVWLRRLPVSVALTASVSQLAVLLRPLASGVPLAVPLVRSAILSRALVATLGVAVGVRVSSVVRRLTVSVSSSAVLSRPQTLLRALFASPSVALLVQGLSAVTRVFAAIPPPAVAVFARVTFVTRVLTLSVLPAVALIRTRLRTIVVNLLAGTSLSKLGPQRPALHSVGAYLSYTHTITLEAD